MRTLRFFLGTLAAVALVVLPAYLWPRYAESSIGTVALLPLLSIYFFHALGVPGLLEHNGACGWGWCAPTPFGWAFLFAFWAGAMWWVAWVLSRLTRRSRRTPSGGPSAPGETG